MAKVSPAAIRMALQWADESARSRVESECIAESHGRYDVATCNETDVEYLKEAFKYMRLRGENLPYTVHFEGHIVWFKDAM